MTAVLQRRTAWQSAAKLSASGCPFASRRDGRCERGVLLVETAQPGTGEARALIEVVPEKWTRS